MAPSGSVAQAPGQSPTSTTSTATRPTPTTTTSTTTTTTTSTPPVVPPKTSSSSTSVIVPPTNTTAPQLPPTSSSTQPTTSTAPPPLATVTCMSTSQCAVNQLCALQSNQAATGICQTMVGKLCLSNPVVKCQTNADCNDPAFSYCYTEESTGEKTCAGLGRPGTKTECNGQNNPVTPTPKSSNDTVTTTLKYAGIAVGSVALLGIIFALVRWQRNKNRSKVPEFAEIDYGMSTRHRSHRSEPRSSIGAAAVGAGVGAGAGAAAATEQPYPFSSRPHAGGIPAQDGYYDDQYYDDQYAQNMHPMAGMAGGNTFKEQQYYGHYNDGYDQQAYDQQAYDQQYYKEAAAYNGGYDQHGNYVGDGVYYDNGNYNYGDQQQQQPYANQALPATSGADYVTSPTAPPASHAPQTRQGFGEHGNGNYPANN
ncbi:hypothetical protein BGZ51_001522 [Haplosporangium sp. Z 767]|nr:hypothetical protein BGZ51_001522 [Haplosporangium sp. Z 767]KAF9192928.1 hypothetical protein BGZ50_008065 [Haplosporangium sp. Z 11]